MSERDALWGALPVPALLVSDTGHILSANPAAEDFLNLSTRAMEGALVWEKVLMDHTLAGAYLRACENATLLSVPEIDIHRADRAATQCTVQFAPYEQNEAAMLMLVMPRDVSSRLLKTDISTRGARSAIGMAEMLAHEIKNPLAGITGAAQLLSMSLSGEDVALTDLIVAESRRIVTLLEQVEQFGNLLPPNLQAVNVHDVLDRARRSASLGFAAHMEIAEDYDPSLPHTWADPDQLLQVFLNLIKNASEASEKQGKITLRSFYEPALRVRRKDGTVAQLPLQIEVVDDGPGIPADIAAEIFEPFVSGHENGTGLGLALVGKLIHAIGGGVSVDSEPGRTVFRVSLPTVPKDQHA